MEELSRTEYPAMLTSLHPGQAVQVLQERVKRVGKVNQEIADWLRERRKVEEQYVLGLRSLLTLKAPNGASELGVFQPPWEAILRSVDAIANSHHMYSVRVEKDVEQPLRNFQAKKEMANMTTMAGNLHMIAKEFEDAQEKAERLTKKGGKNNAQKIDAATSRLENAVQQWESQAPFIFETLQAIDEQRVNHLRDVLTQLETHEVDQATRTQSTGETMLNLLLEIKTEDEIQMFSQRVTAGRPKLDRRAGGVPAAAPGGQHNTTATTASGPGSISGSVSGPGHGFGSAPGSGGGGPGRSGDGAGHVPQLSQASHFSQVSQASQVSQPPQPSQPLQPSQPSLPVMPPVQDDNMSEHSGRNEDKPESKLRSRIGTMLSRRRQSVHGGFGPLSPSKGGPPFGRNLGSSHSHGRGGGGGGGGGVGTSPRSSTHNLAETNSHRLSSLAETPDSPAKESENRYNSANANANTNGSGHSPNGITADEVFGVPPPPGPPPSRQPATATTTEPAKDAEGFSVPSRMNDPISQAQREAAALGGGVGGDEAEPAFKLNIQNEPIAEEDAAAKKAAMSNVANTLSMAMPSRKTGTVRGRRDVRNTIYIPPPLPPLAQPSPPSAPLGNPELPRTPTFASTGSSGSSKPATAFAALASEASFTGGSDSQSVRSATSLSSLAHLKHPDSASPGLSTSIIETVSASFENGELKATKIAGEIAFSYTAPADGAKDTELVRINNFASLEVIGPNRIFVQNTPAPDEFALHLAHLQPRATVGFTFRAHADNPTALAEHCPLVLRPVWKEAGDKLNLLLHYGLNPAARLASPVTLHNVVLIATYEGARASGAQTKPSGTHLKDKHLVYWRIGDTTLTSDNWHKIVCRIVGEQGAEPKPGHIEARWEYSATATAAASGSASSTGIGVSISRLLPADKGKGKAVDTNGSNDDDQDPFADETAVTSPPPFDVDGSKWVDVPLTRQIVSGRYDAK